MRIKKKIVYEQIHKKSMETISKIGKFIYYLFCCPATDAFSEPSLLPYRFSNHSLTSPVYTYLVADESHPQRPAVLFDPVYELLEEYESFIREHGLKLLFIAYTRVPDDLSRFKISINGAKSIMPKASKVDADILVEHGDTINLGNLYLEVRATSEQTTESVSYVVIGGHRFIAFTGDALQIGEDVKDHFEEQFMESTMGDAKPKIKKSSSFSVLSSDIKKMCFKPEGYAATSASHTQFSDSETFKPKLSRIRCDGVVETSLENDNSDSETLTRYKFFGRGFDLRAETSNSENDKTK